MDRYQRPINPSPSAQAADADPRRRFPRHFEALGKALSTEGLSLADWTILNAAEIRLDEYGMEVEVVMLRRWACQPSGGQAGNDLRTWRVIVRDGNQADVRCIDGGPAPQTPLRGSMVLRLR